MAKSVYELFQKTVAARGSRVAAQYKVAGAWRDVTWDEMADTSLQVSAALVEMGVAPKSRISIVSNTRLEWIFADVGILGADCTTVPVYQSNLAHEVEYILTDAGTSVVFVEDNSQLKKMREIRDQVPNVSKVIAFTGDVEGDWEISFEDFLKKGAEFLKDNRAKVDERAESLTPDDILTFIYTSGTTGKPKGTILKHDSMIYEAEATEKVGLIGPDDVQFLFLPMAHVFAKVLEVTWFASGHVMAFWEGDQKKIVDNMGETRPTIMAAVPRIYEKVHAKVVDGAVSAPGIKGKLGRWALQKSEEAAAIERRGGTPGGLGWALAQKLVFSKIQERLNGLFGGRLRFFISGGAPLSPDIAYFFKHAGVTICEGYGLTETSAASTVNLPNDIRIGTVGKPMPGTEVKIAGDGEILIRGRGVMAGYWNRPDATKEAINDDGWFHTGDIGEFDNDGYLRITDRKKDIIVTAGGKNVAPQNIENLIKSKSPLISQVVIHGDQRKFLSALITVDPDNVENWAKTNGLSGDHAALSKKPELRKEIEAVVSQVNGTLASYETLKKFEILDHDFEIGEQLTPTMKVKRKVCNEKYKDILDGFYK